MSGIGMALDSYICIKPYHNKVQTNRILSKHAKLPYA